MAAVNEKKRATIRGEDSADITTHKLAGVVLHETVGMLSDTVDLEKRTLPVRIVVLAPGTRLRSGMFAMLPSI